LAETRHDRVLAGKRIVVTRAPEQSDGLIGALERMGAEVLLLPLVRFAAPESWVEADAAIARLTEFNWVLFASQNAVRFFSGRCREIRDLEGKDALLQPPGICAGAVGPATAQALRREGWRVDYTAKVHTAEALARELGNSLEGKKVLLPRSDQGDERLPNALREAGAEIREVIVYRTAKPGELDPAILQQFRRAQVDAIVFASPSAFRSLCDVVAPADLAKISRSVSFAAIGPTTARALREAGSRVEIEAGDSSAAALADAIRSYYQRQSWTTRSV
jgi:uroporphyrinogen III methyltransferase / synthase